MTQYKPRTWKDIPEEKSEEVRKFLLSKGANFDEKVTEPEVWRARLQDNTVFTMYSKGTLFCSAPRTEAVFKLQQEISFMLGQTIEKPDKQFLIGLDETGKGEILGHSILAGVIIPSNLLQEVNNMLGPADTKKRKSTAYWDSLFIEIDGLRRQGLNFIVEKIPPWHVDKYNLNKIMDLVYQRIITHLIQGVPADQCRIIVDDYGVGRNLSEYLESLHKQGCEVREESKADDKYDECRLASVISKRERMLVMQAINRGYSLPDFPVGSGNAGAKQTVAWLKEWWNRNKEWPWFVKKSFSTVQEIEGRKTKVKKVDPPIRHELLTNESQKLFREGKLSVASLTMLCPTCGGTMHSCKITPSDGEHYVGRCIKCSSIIENLNTTLLYYCGYIVLDSNVIFEKIVHRDLEKGKFFEGFTFLLHPEVLRECDTENGRKELEAFARFASLGRIKLEEITNVEPASDTDESIVESARRCNAMLYSRDNRIHAMAMAKNVFLLK